MSFGRGVVHARAGKQKLNVKSSTEAELAGVSEYLPYNIHITNFIEEQGYKLTKNEIRQDNESAIRMEKMVGIHAQVFHDMYTYDTSL